MAGGVINLTSGLQRLDKPLASMVIVMMESFGWTLTISNKFMAFGQSTSILIIAILLLIL
jgi:hypothetical protein